MREIGDDMSTAIVAIGAFGIVAFCLWLMREGRMELRGLVYERDMVRRENGQLMERIAVLQEENDELLRQKVNLPSMRPAPDALFDRDKMQDKQPQRRFVPISVRRAMAERQSLGPATHDEKVRQNNERAMEVAG